MENLRRNTEGTVSGLLSESEQRKKEKETHSFWVPAACKRTPEAEAPAPARALDTTKG